MAFLDFIKNRQEQQPVGEQQSQQQQPETAKQMYSREAVEAKAAEKPVAQIPESDKASARDIGSRVEQYSQDRAGNAFTGAPAPADSSAAPQAMRQDANGQDKSAPALSPTDGQVAKTALEKAPDSPSQGSQEKEPSSQSPAHTPNPPQRDRGGWER